MSWHQEDKELTVTLNYRNKHTQILPNQTHQHERKFQLCQGAHALCSWASTVHERMSFHYTVPFRVKLLHKSSCIEVPEARTANNFQQKIKESPLWNTPKERLKFNVSELNWSYQEYRNQWNFQKKKKAKTWHRGIIYSTSQSPSDKKMSPQTQICF